MNTDPAHQYAFITRLATWSTVASLLVVFGVTAAQGYIRWKINQNFTLLGGYELEVLTVSTSALLFALLLVSRPRHS